MGNTEVRLADPVRPDCFELKATQLQPPFIVGDFGSFRPSYSVSSTSLLFISIAARLRPHHPKGRGMSLRSLLLLALLCAAGMHTVHARRALMQGDEGGADEDLLAPAPAAAAALPAAAWDWAPAPTPAAVPIQTFNLEPTDDDVGPATEDGEQAADNQEAEKPKPKPKKRNTSIERYDPETSYTADTPLNLREGSRATVGDVPTAQGAWAYGGVACGG